MSVNPYDGVGQFADGDRFVGRLALLELVRRSWQNTRPANLALQGNHRMGKTSLVRRAESLFARAVPDLVAVYLSVSGFESAMDLFRELVTQTRMAADGLRPYTPPEWRGEQLGDIEMGVQDSAAWPDLKWSVAQFFKALHRNGIRVVIVLDEFDHAAVVFREVDFQFLRDLVSEDYSAGLITLSRQSVKSIEMSGVGHSTLDGVMGKRRPVGPFEDVELDQMLGRAIAAGIDLAPLRGDIVRHAGHHPYLVELLCHELVETGLAGAVDFAAAWEQAEPQFRDQFARSLANLDRDLGGAGVDMLYQVLTRTHLTVEDHQLKLMRDLGLVRSSGTGLELLSPEFTEYARRTALSGAMSGWWLDREQALRRRVGKKLRNGRSGAGLVELDPVAVFELVATNWADFADDLPGGPEEWAERLDLLAAARAAGDRGVPLDPFLRYQVTALLGDLPVA
jgi:AAA domain